MSGILFVEGQIIERKEDSVSIVGMALMWVFSIVVFIIITRWPMGKVSDERANYWAKYEKK